MFEELNLQGKIILGVLIFLCILGLVGIGVLGYMTYIIINSL